MLASVGVVVVALTVSKDSWRKHRAAIEGLSAVLSIVHEQGDALRCEDVEDAGA
jgi:hypothetical protein